VQTLYKAEGSPLGQLIVVSNRVSVPERTASARAGGLEVAVNAALKERRGLVLGLVGAERSPHLARSQQKRSFKITLPL
jgi:trehalose-6-phosphate synthase